jgi:hypothetical protein
MKVDENELREGYKNMSDDELADVVRSSELTEIAQNCLNDELQKRGRDNLDDVIYELNKRDRKEEEIRQDKLAKGKNAINKFCRPFYTSGVFFLIIAVLLMLVPAQSKGAQLWQLSLFLGFTLIIFGKLIAVKRLVILHLVMKK